MIDWLNQATAGWSDGQYAALVYGVILVMVVTGVGMARSLYRHHLTSRTARHQAAPPGVTGHRRAS